MFYILLSSYDIRTGTTAKTFFRPLATKQLSSFSISFTARGVNNGNQIVEVKGGIDYLIDYFW